MPINIPLVNLTGAPMMQAPVQSGTTIAAAGQFANRIQRNAPQPQFINANGSTHAPATSQFGAQGEHGAMLPQVSNNAVFGGPVNLQSNRVSPPYINTNTFQAGGPILPSPVGSGLSTANLTGANNARYTYQGLYKPDAEEIRQRHITQLTAPYQGSLAAITGANMVEPVNMGFPGTDPRQPVPISNQALGLPTNQVTQTYTGGGGGGGRKRGGGGSYGGASGSRNYGGYGGNIMSQVLNWRVATG